MLLKIIRLIKAVIEEFRQHENSMTNSFRKVERGVALYGGTGWLYYDSSFMVFLYEVRRVSYE